MFFRHRIGEAIAEIERGRVHASSPARISLADPPRCSRRHRHDIEIKPVQDVRHLGPDPSPGGNDQHFGQRARRNQDLTSASSAAMQASAPGSSRAIAISAEVSSAIIWGDHRGRPSSS